MERLAVIRCTRANSKESQRCKRIDVKANNTTNKIEVQNMSNCSRFSILITRWKSDFWASILQSLFAVRWVEISFTNQNKPLWNCWKQTHRWHAWKISRTSNSPRIPILTHTQILGGGSWTMNNGFDKKWIMNIWVWKPGILRSNYSASNAKKFTNLNRLVDHHLGLWQPKQASAFMDTMLQPSAQKQQPVRF